MNAVAVVTLDGDGQHPPEEIPRQLAAQLAEPRSISIGSRLHDAENIPLDRCLANRFANFWIAWAARHRIEDSQSGFSVYSEAAWREVLPRCCGVAFVFESEVLIEAGRAGFRLLAVPVRAVYSGHARRSHFRPVLDVSRIARMIAWKLLSRGLYVSGLVRLLRTERLQRAEASREVGPTG